MNHIGNILQTHTFDTNTHMTNHMHTDIDGVDDFFADDILPATDSPLSNTTADNSSATSLDTDTIQKLQQMIASMKEQLHTMEGMLAGTIITSHMPVTPSISAGTPSLGFQAAHQQEEDGEVIEGVFTGTDMLGADGKNYPMSPNYASKSKLVQGDRMKLTISPSGSFIYKQIGPVERRHMRGNLLYDAVNNQWSVFAEGKTYKILTASVTFHKGSVGSDVSIIVPASIDCEWAAVEHIM